MTGPTIRVHRTGLVTADGDAIGRVYRNRYGRNPADRWAAALPGRHIVAVTRLRREAVSALLDHTYGKDRWT